MKTLIILLFFVSIAEAGIFSWVTDIPLIGTLFGGKKHTEITTDIGTKNTNIDKVEGNVEKNKQKISALEGWKNTFELQMTNKFEKLVDAKIIGYDRSQTAGRDIYKISKNDGKTIFMVVGGLFGFMSFMVFSLTTIITLLIRKIFKQQGEWVHNLIESNKEKKKLIVEKIYNGGGKV